MQTGESTTIVVGLKPPLASAVDSRVSHEELALEFDEEDVLADSAFGRRRYLLNAPDAIHRVLVENTANYRRTAATIRSARCRTVFLWYRPSA